MSSKLLITDKHMDNSDLVLNVDVPKSISGKITLGFTSSGDMSEFMIDEYHIDRIKLFKAICKNLSTEINLT